MTTSQRLRYRAGLADLRDALAFPLTSNARLASAGLVAVATYVLLVLSAFPQFSIQVLTRDPTDVVYAVETLTRQVYLSAGWVGIGLVTIYAILTGIAVTNAVTLLRHTRSTGASTVAGIVPGVLAAGRASCGAGVLGALGYVGVMAVLPFDGNLLRVGGVVLLLVVLANAGDPRTCAVSIPSDT